MDLLKTQNVSLWSISICAIISVLLTMTNWDFAITGRREGKRRNFVMKKKILTYPIGVIILGWIIAIVLTPIMKEWTFIPLAFVYWGTTIAIVLKTVGFQKIKKMFKKPIGKKRWNILALFVGLIPLSILLMNLSLLKLDYVLILWIAFALINPFFEEIFWRGFLIDALPMSKRSACLYSTFLFVVSHPIMWGTFSIANRSWMTVVSLIIMGLAWSIVYLKTKSLRWCVISHFLVDIFNLSVYVFLNLYIPPVM